MGDRRCGDFPGEAFGFEEVPSFAFDQREIKVAHGSVLRLESFRE